jgi:biotin-dependent carboxylase-like uncharacterized protein
LALLIVEAGWSTTIQDRGRPGRASLGVPTAGAVDRSSLALANRLVGNGPDAAALETAHGLVVEAVGALIVATSSDGIRHTMRAGDRLVVGRPPDGMWGYLAVRGGIDVAPVLGSRSHDTLAGLGPPALSAGTVLPVGREPASELPADLAPPRDRPQVVRVWPGPQHGWFGGLDQMAGRTWTVGPDVSRVGVRLTTGALVPRTRRRVTGGEETDHGTMSSFALIEGAIQITPSDEAIVMLANHPTTGGYPVIAVVEPDDIPIVAQARPGTNVGFRAP